MNSAPVDVSEWTRFHADRKHPLWWGIWGLIAIELTVMVTFLASFFYLWIVNVASGEGWPPPGTELPPVLYPTLSTVLLIVCAASMYYGGNVMAKGQNIRFAWSVVVCSIAGGLVTLLRWLQFDKLPFAWDTNVYASFVWTLTGFHLMHVISAVLGTIVIGWLAAKGYYTEQRRLGIQVDTLYWYFVSFIWIPIYIVLYWTPHWG